MDWSDSIGPIRLDMIGPIRLHGGVQRGGGDGRRRGGDGAATGGTVAKKQRPPRDGRTSKKNPVLQALLGEHLIFPHTLILSSPLRPCIPIFPLLPSAPATRTSPRGAARRPFTFAALEGPFPSWTGSSTQGRPISPEAWSCGSARFAARGVFHIGPLRHLSPLIWPPPPFLASVVFASPSSLSLSFASSSSLSPSILPACLSEDTV